MEYRQIEAFLAVVRTGTFTRAAEELSLTQPAVTRSVGALEAELGAKLLDRLGRRVALTAAGHAFLEYAEKMLQSADEAKRIVRDIEAGTCGPLTIAASSTLATYLLPDILSRYGAAHPHVELQLRTGPSAQVIGMVLENKVDFGLVMDRQIVEGVVSSTVGSYRHVVVTSPSHPLSSGACEPIEPEALLKYPLITMDEGSTLRRQVGAILQVTGEQANVSLVVDNVETIKQMVRAGLGIAILPDMSVVSERSSGLLNVRTIADGDGVCQEIMAISRGDRYTSRAMRHMLRMLTEPVEEQVAG